MRLPQRELLPTFNTNSIEQWLYRVPGMPESATSFIHMNDDYLFLGPVQPQDLFGPTCSGVRVLVENRPVAHMEENAFLAQLQHPGGRTWPLSVTGSVVALQRHYGRQSVHPYLKHAPFIYVREACKDITTTLFQDESVSTSTHKFRHPGDVVMPFLYSGVIRAVDPVTRLHPKYKVMVTVEPEDEMSKFVLLSLHGVPKPPLKEQHAHKRADAWYPDLLDRAQGFKHVAINDEMQGESNRTVVAMLHRFYLELLPQPSPFEHAQAPFVPQPMPPAAADGR